MPFTPIAAAQHAHEMDLFMVLVHAVLIAGFLGWFLWFAIALVRFRGGRKNPAEATPVKPKWPIVAIVSVALAEAVLLFGFAIPYWNKNVASVPLDDPDAFRVRVIAQQYQWNIHYPGADGIFGRTAVEFMDDQTNLIGLDHDDPNGKDDIATLNIMHLPVDRMAIVELTTKDVIHGFSLPEFRIKQDTIPGMRIPVYFKPILTTDEFRSITGDDARTFEIACAQLCGITHYRMRGFLYIDTQSDFDAWYTKKLTSKNAFDDDL